MRKIRSFFFLLAIILLSNFSLIANAETKDVYTLQYNEIEQIIFENNLNIQTNMMSLDSMNESLKDLKAKKSGSQGDIEKQAALIDMEIEYYQYQLLLLQPLSIPGFPDGKNSVDGNNYIADNDEEENQEAAIIVNDPALYAAVNNSITYIRRAYTAEIINLEQRKEALLAPINMSDSEIDTQILNLTNSIHQLTKTNYLFVKESQSLFLLYHSLDFDYNNLLLELESRTSELEFAKLKRDLGMTNEEELEAIQDLIDNINKTVEDLEEQKTNILKQLNSLIGREQDKPLRLTSTPKLESKVIELDYDDDLIEVKENSYSYLVNQNDYKIKSLAFEDAKKNYNSSSDERKKADLELKEALISRNDKEKEIENNFESICEDLIDKLDTITTEEQELVEAKKDLTMANLKYSLGMISKLEKEKVNVLYEKQQIELNRAQHNLKRTYLDYQWIKEGLS